MKKIAKDVWIAGDKEEFETEAECVAHECMGELDAEVDEYLATLDITDRARAMRASMIRGWLEYDIGQNSGRYVAVPEESSRVATIGE